MLDLTHLNISDFEWGLEEIERKMKQNKKEKLNPLDNFANFYSFGNLKTEDRLQVIDEFISSFFTNDRVENRWDKKYLPQQFKKTLEDVGYNMDNPPARKKMLPQELFWNQPLR